MANEQQQTEQSNQNAMQGSNATSQSANAMQPRSSSASAQTMSRPSSPMGRISGPFSLTRRLTEEMDRMFEDFFSGNFFGMSMMPWQERSSAVETTRWPQIELAQNGNKLEIRADVPGLKKEDVKVEVHENQLRIWGERRSESERNEGGLYRSERSYGHFSRTIQLPEHANLDSTSASFENGVLKIEIEVPALEARQPRQIEVQDASQRDTRH
jgi:HSP20 family protein